MIFKRKIFIGTLTIACTLCATLSFCMPANAKAKNIKMVDYGNGFVLPESFDSLVGRDGSLARLDSFNPEWLCVEYDGTPVVMDLGNGYTASREYVYQKYYDDGMNVEMPYIATYVYDADGNIVYSVGRDGDGTAYSCVVAPNGDYACDYFSEPDLRSDDEGRMYDAQLEGELAEKITGDTFNLAYSWEDEAGNWQTLSRTEMYMDTKTKKEYLPGFEGLKLARKTEYATDNGVKYTDYYVTYPNPDGLPEDDEFFEAFSYYKNDLEVVTTESTHVLYAVSGEVHPGLRNQLTPSVKYLHGEPYYLFIFENREPGDYIDPVSGDVQHNQKDESIGYFTKEQIEIINAEGLKSEEEIYKAHRDFFFDPMHREPFVEGSDEEYVSEADLKEAAVVNGNDREAEIENTPSTSGPRIEGGITQTIVGDVVPINGKTPVYAITRTMINGSVRIDLFDASYNEVAVGGAFDLEHTKHKYVYFEFLSIMNDGNVLFEMSGTDNASMGGNLGGYGSGTYDTENGQTGSDDYYRSYGEPEVYDAPYYEEGDIEYGY